MAGKSTQLTLKVAAINATSRVFRNIASSAMGVTKSIAKWGSVAAVAVGGAFAVTANKLSKLSDVAQAAGASTEELTKLSGALDLLGVKGSAPEELAASFQRMVKTTGQVGVEGFHRVVEEISKLPTMQERATAAMQVFGRTGLQFMPIIEGAAKNGMGALKDLEAAIPGISQAAAEAGDRSADALNVISREAAKIWNEGLMKVAELITGQFTGDVRTAALICAAHMEYFAKAAWAYLKPFIDNTKGSFLQMAEWISRVMNNALTIVGGIVVTMAENFADQVKGVYEDTIDGAKLLWADITGDDAAHDAIVKRGIERNDKIAKRTAANWDMAFKVLEDQLEWGLGDGPLANVDLSALEAQRDAAVEAAKKGGEAIGKAAVTIGASERAKYGALGAQGAQKNVNPEALLGGTYKAVTFALRAGYGTAQEKIAKGVEKLADILQGVKKNTADIADNLNIEGV